MNSSLRRQHWRWLVLLALTLPLLLLLILGSRDFSRHAAPVPESILDPQPITKPDPP